MKNYEKIESLREQLNKTLDPKIKEYVEAELNYSSEIANGYVRADQLKAELRLIAAIEALTKPMENGRTKSMKVTKLYDPLMHQRLTLSVTIVAQQMMSRVGGELYESLVKDHIDV